MGNSQASDEGQQLIGQLKQIGEYSSRCRSGYGELKDNLKSLYGELDGLVESVPLDGEGVNYHGYHKEYKSSLNGLVETQLSKYDELGSLVAKILSGSVTDEAEIKSIISSISEDYQTVRNGSITVYTLLEPKHDASKLVNGFYLHLADGLKIDILPVFNRCVDTLKKYFLPENIDEQIGSPEAMPQAA